MESFQVDLIEPPKIPTYTTYLPPLKYEKLPTPTSIRLLKIDRLPSIKDDLDLFRPITCSLVVKDLNDRPKYDALSYTWGDPLGRESSSSDSTAPGGWATTPFGITCNGQRVKVTTNLHTSLIAIRFHLARWPNKSIFVPFLSVSEYLWVDQICINQADTAEKSSQVQLMGQIYRQCATVQIWLGGYQKDISSLQYVYRSILRLLDGSDGSEYKSFDITDQRVCELLGIRPISLENARGMLDFFNRGWFKRSWIIQEALLAPMSNVLFGVHGGPFPDLSTFMEFLACEATDPRDKVYAFIGISENDANQRGPQIIPDYSKMVDDVYIDAIKLMMLPKGFSLDCFSQKEDKGLRRIKSLPSWVPDFSVDLGHNPLVVRGSMFAAGPRAPTNHFQYLPSNCIELRGSRVDAVRLWKGEVVHERPFYAGQESKSARQIREIMYISTNDVVELMALVPESSAIGPQSSDLSCKDENYAKNCSPIMSTLVQIAPSPEQTISYQSRTEVFWRTMMKDIGNNRYPAEERCGEELLKEMEEVVHLEMMELICEHTLDSMDVEEWKVRTDHVMKRFTDLQIIKGVMPYGTTDTQNPKHFAGARSVILSRRENAVDERLWQNFLHYRVNFNTRTLGLCNPDAYRLDVKEEVFMTAKGRGLFVTDKGRLGWGLLSTRAGDEVWILEGCRVPCLLRPRGDGGYSLVGEAYVHGIMHGEALEGLDVKDLNPVIIV
ncbi:het-domain-containing protein [Fusarium mundagurra]|uniref:Het-domain-containing protein n=1 Tax=Fusarium mundagurra TaxID=1567541 RepID=A0A8H5Z2Z6_9HYPO|nr:het-domain-containing protein [Fusarium mundagurra]